MQDDAIETSELGSAGINSKRSDNVLTLSFKLPFNNKVICFLKVEMIKDIIS